MSDHKDSGTCFCKQCCWEAYLRGEAETNYKIMERENASRSGGYSPDLKSKGTQEPRKTERTHQPRLGDRRPRK